jgi:hypothetical protein
MTMAHDISGHPDAAIDEIVTRCSGDMRGAVEALLLVNEHLERELSRVYSAAGFGSIQRRARCVLH